MTRGMVSSHAPAHTRVSGIGGGGVLGSAAQSLRTSASRGVRACSAVTATVVAWRRSAGGRAGSAAMNHNPLAVSTSLVDPGSVDRGRWWGLSGRNPTRGGGIRSLSSEDTRLTVIPSGAGEYIQTLVNDRNPIRGGREGIQILSSEGTRSTVIPSGGGGYIQTLVNDRNPIRGGRGGIQILSSEGTRSTVIPSGGGEGGHPDTVIRGYQSDSNPIRRGGIQPDACQ